MHDGCNARAWVCFELPPTGGTAEGQKLPAGTRLMTRQLDGSAAAIRPEKFQEAFGESQVVFETCHEITLRAARNAISFYKWSDEQCCLPRGATRATLKNDPLCLSALVNDANGKPIVREVSVARGNVALADHGLTLPAVTLPTPRNRTIYRPELPHHGLTIAQTYASLKADLEPASTSLQQDPRKALPSVVLKDANDTWTVQRDLLRSDRFATDFVVELEDDAGGFLRFGDDVLGQRPEPGTLFTTVCRVGSGAEGNVGAEALAHAVCNFPDLVRVRNPLPARGGTNPETLIEVRQFAPQAFRTQERALTEADYAAAAEKHPEVRRAAARFRWTGSWHTVFITIDRAFGRPVDEDPGFEEAVRLHLERFRLAGYDLEIQGPIMLPLEIAFTICIRPGYFRTSVKEALLEEFGNRDLPDGRGGFFHPDNFTFAQPVFVSQLCEPALRVAGVSVATVTALQRYGQPANDELQRGFLDPADLEIIRLDNDKNFPENGKLTFHLHGGL